MNKILEKYNEDESISFDIYEDDVVSNINFTFENIEDVVFKSCKFESVSFNDLAMFKVKFINCELTNCSFLNINYNKFVIEDSKLTNVVFSEGKGETIEYKDSLFQFCNFSEMKIRNCDFNTRFVECSLYNLEMQDVNFGRSELKEVKIDGLLCRNVLFSDANIESVNGSIKNFSGATISMAQALELVMKMGIKIKEI